MNLPAPPQGWDIDQLTAERAEAVSAFGFTERQARFLIEVLIHGGVFVERQYCDFAGISHGQKSTDFLRRLVGRGYVRPIQVGAKHPGRLFHVHHKPLYAAIGQADNRNRKPVALGRMVERVMLLDAVLADRSVTWLGSESDKRSYFRRVLQGRVDPHELPRLTFGSGAEVTHRYFPDKLPIGVERYRTEHVFLYLMTSPSPMDFRLFLLRHSEMFRPLVRWTVRVLVPAPLTGAIRLYGLAAREELATPVSPSSVEDLEWLFSEWRRSSEAPSEEAERVRSLASAYRAPRYRALYRMWLQHGKPAIWSAQSATLRDALQRGEGRVEFVRLTHRYCHLSSMVGVA